VNKGSSDIALMLLVKSGDEGAFEILHSRYQRKVVAFFWGLIRDAQLANDLCQETFLRVWMVRKRYQATGTFCGYLFGIARMIWLERSRTIKKESRLGTPCTLEALEWCMENMADKYKNPAENQELTDAFWNALAVLPEEQRMVFVMRNIEGLSLDDIATALDCPVNTVRSRKMLAVNKLRVLLSDVYTALIGANLNSGGGR